MFLKARKVIMLLAVVFLVPSILGGCTLFGKPQNNNDDPNQPENPTLTSISLNVEHATLEFFMGQPFTSEGLLVYANYSNNTQADVTSSAVIDSSLYQANTAGTYAITVTYATFSTNYNVTVTNTYGTQQVTDLFLNSYALWQQSRSAGYVMTNGTDVYTYAAVLAPGVITPFGEYYGSFLLEEEEDLTQAYNQLFFNIVNSDALEEGTTQDRDETLALIAYSFADMVTYLNETVTNPDYNSYVINTLGTLLLPYLQGIGQQDDTFTIGLEGDLFYVQTEAQQSILDGSEPVLFTIYFDDQQIIRNIKMETYYEDETQVVVFMMHYGNANTTTAQTSYAYYEQMLTASYQKILQTQTLAAVMNVRSQEEGFSGTLGVALQMQEVTPYVYSLQSMEPFDGSVYPAILFGQENMYDTLLQEDQQDLNDFLTNLFASETYETFFNLENENNYNFMLQELASYSYMFMLVSSFDPQGVTTVTENGYTTYIYEGDFNFSLTVEEQTNVIVGFDAYLDGVAVTGLFYYQQPLPNNI